MNQIGTLRITTPSRNIWNGRKDLTADLAEYPMILLTLRGIEAKPSILYWSSASSFTKAYSRKWRGRNALTTICSLEIFLNLAATEHVGFCEKETWAGFHQCMRYMSVRATAIMARMWEPKNRCTRFFCPILTCRSRAGVLQVLHSITTCTRERKVQLRAVIQR